MLRGQTQTFQKLFLRDIFLYLLNIFVAADPKLEQKF